MFELTYPSGKTEGYVFLEIKYSYDTSWSKNKLWRHGKKRVFLSKEASRNKKNLASEIQIHQKPWIDKKKLWVYIFVSRPDLRADPANFIDMILDGVKVGTSVDDRYYSIHTDWELKRKTEGYISIKLAQDTSSQESF